MILVLPINVENAQNKNRPSSTEIGIRRIGYGIISRLRPIRM